MGKKLFAIVLFTSVSNFILAQSTAIKGKITDVYSNQALSGVSVNVPGFPVGTTTDSLGNYSLSGLKPGVYNLQFGFVGYRSKSVFDIAVNQAKPTILDIALETDVSQLDEVNIKTQRFIKPIESPLSLRTIGVTEIKRNPGGNRDISKVIQSLPGVSGACKFS